MTRTIRISALLASLMVLMTVPATAQDEQGESTEPQRLAEGDEEFSSCTAALVSLGAEFEIGDPILEDDDKQCGIIRPLTVSKIVRGVELQPPGPMRCATARALAEWVDEFVVPASRSLPERSLVTRINHASTYVCRRRNNQATGKLSEHAYGNAVDVVSFEFAKGKPIPVEPREREGTPAEAFQDAVRATACLKFTTVLGPGTDDAHDDHLHMDIKERNGGFRLCQ